MSRQAHLRFSGNGSGAFTFELDGVDISKVVRSRDFSITIETDDGPPRAVAHFAIDTSKLDVDLQGVTLDVADALRAELGQDGA